jgi:LytR cell envelope-related transcriptional attenuator
MHRMRRASRVPAVWPQPGSVIPQWVFWTVLVAVALACGLAIGYLGNPIDSAPVSSSAQGRGEARLSNRGEETAVVEEPARSTAAEDSNEATAATGDDNVTEQAAQPELVTEGVTVQVLNASANRRADNRLADRLESLGFEIVAVNPAAKIYRNTTVFWSKPSGRDASRALAEHFDWKSAPRPRNLSKSVTTHVVVGRDEL